MATSTNPLEAIADGEDSVPEQDRRKFKPLRAIKRIFKGKKKSKGLSQSMGSMLTPNYDDTASPASLARSISHESIFAKDGIASGLPEDGKLRAVLSVGDVTEVPSDGLKVDLAKETVASTSSMSKMDKVQPKKTGKSDTSTAESKGGEFFGNMNDLTTDVTRLNNKLAYDKISVRPKRRPAKNARRAQQTHIVRIEEAPTPVNGFDGVEITDESPERKRRDLSPGPSAIKASLPGLQIHSIAEDSTTTEAPIRPLRKSPIRAVPTGFVPSLQDVQAFKKRSKRIEEVTEPVASKPTENTVKVTVAQTSAVEKSKSPKAGKKPPKKSADFSTEHVSPKPVDNAVKTVKIDAAEKSKKSPKTSKKAQKKSGESASSVFSWKNKIRSPASPRKTKSDSPKDESKSKGLFAGLKTKKNADKDAKSTSAAASKLFFQGEKKEQTKKKGVANEPATEKKEIENAHQITKKEISDDKQDDVTDTKEKFTPVDAENKVTSPVKEATTPPQFSPPLHSKTHPPGGMSLFDEINFEMTRKMKSKAHPSVEKENSTPKSEDAQKLVKERKEEKDETLTTEPEVIGDLVTTAAFSATAVLKADDLSKQTVEKNTGGADSESPAAVQNKPVPIARVKKDIASQSERQDHADEKNPSTTETKGTKHDSSTTESIVTSPAVADILVVKSESVKDEPSNEESAIVETPNVRMENDISAEIVPTTTSVKAELDRTDSEISNVEIAAQKDLVSQTLTGDKINETESSKVDDHPNKESRKDSAENKSSGTNLEESVPLQKATSKLSVVAAKSNESESISTEISDKTDVASANVKVAPKVIASDDVAKCNSAASDDSAKGNSAETDKPQVEHNPLSAQISVKSQSSVDSTNSAKSDLLSPSSTASSQSASDLFSQAKLKPVSRNVANRKSASVKISPGEPMTKPSRPHSWNTKHTATSSQKAEKATSIQVEPTANQQSNPISKPRVAMKPKSPVTSPVKSLTKRFSQNYSDKPPLFKSSDYPGPMKSPEQKFNLKFTEKPSSPVKSPDNFVGAKSPTTPPWVKNQGEPAKRTVDDDAEKTSASKSPNAQAKPVPRRAKTPVKQPQVKIPERQASVKSLDRETETVIIVKALEAEEKPVSEPAKSPVKQPEVRSPEKKPRIKSIDQDAVKFSVAEEKSVRNRAQSSAKSPPIKSPVKQPSLKYNNHGSENDSVVTVIEVEAKSAAGREKTPAKTPHVQSPDKQPSLKSIDQDDGNRAETKPVPKPTRSSVKVPRAKSPDKQPSLKYPEPDAEDSNVFKEPEVKAVVRRANERQKREDSGKETGSEPSWIKIARRRSKHWDDGAARPKSSSNPAPTAQGSDLSQPRSLSTTSKQRSQSSSKAEIVSPKNSPVSPTRVTKSNRTSSNPAVSPSENSSTAKTAGSSDQGKPSWLAIAMQKQKSWGTKEEMV